MRRRQAFTITELLVSMALIMFIMAILAEAFVAGLETFRQLKAVGDMDQRLRAASTILRRDLNANWFQKGAQYFTLSTLNFQKPEAGFFTIGGKGATFDSGKYLASDMSYGNQPTITLVTPPDASLTSNMYIYIYPTAGGDPIPVMTSSTYAGGPANPVILAPPPPAGLTDRQTYNVSWDQPTGLFDNSFPAGPQPGIFVTDPDGLPSPFAKDFKLYFSVDLSRVPTGLPTYKPKRRENYISATAPDTIDNNNAATIYSPLLNVNPGNSVTKLADPAKSQVTNRTPFQDPTNYLTQAGEVAYFLMPNGSKIPNPPPPPGSGTTQYWDGSLYSLYRRQLALLSDQDASTMNGLAGINAIPSALINTLWSQQYYDFSGIPFGTQMQFNTLKTVSSPSSRCLTFSAYNPGPFTGVGACWIDTFPRLGQQKSLDPLQRAGRNEPSSVWGSDLLLTDVISFSVRMLPNPVPAFDTRGNPIVDPFLYPGNGYMDQARNLYYLPGAFDTAFMDTFKQNNDNSSSNFKVPSIQAVEIVIRVWDQKTQRARQITIVQAM